MRHTSLGSVRKPMDRPSTQWMLSSGTTRSALGVVPNSAGLMLVCGSTNQIT